MTLRKDSALGRVFFWSMTCSLLGSSESRWRASRIEDGQPTDLCFVMRQVFIYTPLTLLLYGGVGAVILTLLQAHPYEALTVFGAFVGVAVVLLGIAFVVVWATESRYGVLGEWVRAKKGRYCPRVEFR